MRPLLGQRLVCFYCNNRSPQKKTANLRQWHCYICEADNYLDENGQITDPPSSDDASSNLRYAQTIERPTSPVLASPDETLFCRKCIKNQLLLTQSLASYLPPTTDPDYDAYEVSYPKYRKNLELRYPQVCEECEPRVRERIQATGYAAKTDHLRRMMEKSRSSPMILRSWSWRDVVVCLGAYGWWANFCGQIIWHTMGTLAVPSDGLIAPDHSTSFLGCLGQAIDERQVEEKCLMAGRPAASFAMVLGLLAIWWNPCLKIKIKGTGGRMVGLGEFYKLQMLGLVVSSVALYMLWDRTTSHLEQPTLRALHAVMLAFTLAISWISYRTVQMDYKPRVIFQDYTQPLIAHQNQIRNDSKFLESHSNAELLRPQPQRAFPINRLAPAPQSYAHPRQPPTPPPDELDDGAMDWTPSQEAFRPMQTTHTLRSLPPSSGPSPFYGNLPPAPISQAHRIRNPPIQPTVLQRASNQHQNFLRRFSGSTDTVDDQYRSSSQDDDETPTPSVAPTPSRIQMAPPRFFPQSDSRSDTGLESLFTAAFSIKDEPVEVQIAREHPADAVDLRISMNATWLRLFNICFLTVACLAWSIASTQREYTETLRLIAVAAAAVVAVRGLLDSMRTDKDFWSLSETMLSFVELAAAIYLGSAVKSSRVADDVLQGYVPSGFLGFMVVQEMALCGQELRVASFVNHQMQIEQAEESLSPSEPEGSRSTNTNEPRILAPERHPRSHTKIEKIMTLSELSTPRVTRSQVKWESLVPSSNFGGLSLGLGESAELPAPKPKYSSWAAEQRGVATGNTRSRARTPGWDRGTL